MSYCYLKIFKRVTSWMNDPGDLVSYENTSSIPPVPFVPSLFFLVLRWLSGDDPLQDVWPLQPICRPPPVHKTFLDLKQFEKVITLRFRSRLNILFMHAFSARTNISTYFQNAGERGKRLALKLTSCDQGFVTLFDLWINKLQIVSRI